MKHSSGFFYTLKTTAERKTHVAKKKALPVQVDKADVLLKDFFDLVAPFAVEFMPDHFVFGDTYCVIKRI